MHSPSMEYFKCVNVTLYRIASMYSCWYQLSLDLYFLVTIFFKFWGFIVKPVIHWFKFTHGDSGKYVFVCAFYFRSCTIFEKFWHYHICTVDIHNHDVFVAFTWLDWESSHVFCVNLSCFLDISIYFLHHQILWFSYGDLICCVFLWLCIFYHFYFFGPGLLLTLQLILVDIIWCF